MIDERFVPDIMRSTECISFVLPGAAWVIDLVEDRLYLNGERFLTTKQPVKSYYDEGLAKDKGLSKKPIWKGEWGWFVVQLDIGFDGRLFWKFFTRFDYRKKGGKPYFVLSYWNDRKEKELRWYEDDLSVPLFSVPFVGKKKMVLGVIE